MKLPADKQRLIEEFRKSSNAQYACNKAGISRATYYRWKKSDPVFALAVDEAIKEGVDIFNDLIELVLISKAKAGEAWAVKLWLTHNHPKYMNSLRQMLNIEPNQKLSPEQEQLITNALKVLLTSYPLTAPKPADKINDQTYAERNSTEKTTNPNESNDPSNKIQLNF